MPSTPRLPAAAARRLGAARAHMTAAAATVVVESDQGLGIRSTLAPPSFMPHQVDEVVAFFAENGFAVVEGAFSPEELRWMNDLWTRSQQEEPEMWGISEGGAVSDIEFHHPLLDFPELDRFTRHPSTYPMVEKILGGAGKPRYSEFNFRETPPGRGKGSMHFHFDRTPSNASAMDARFARERDSESPVSSVSRPLPRDADNALIVRQISPATTSARSRTLLMSSGAGRPSVSCQRATVRLPSRRRVRPWATSTASSRSSPRREARCFTISRSSTRGLTATS